MAGSLNMLLLLLLPAKPSPDLIVVNIFAASVSEAVVRLKSAAVVVTEAVKPVCKKNTQKS